MTKEEIKNTPEIVDFMLDECVLADSRTKVRKRLEEVCDMAIKALKQEPCEDCISRQAVLDALDKSKYSNEFCEEHNIDWSINLGMAHIVVNELKPVTLQSKAGRWIEHPHEAGENWEYSRYECSECHIWADDDSDYCPNCGAKMEVTTDANSN